MAADRRLSTDAGEAEDCPSTTGLAGRSDNGRAAPPMVGVLDIGLTNPFGMERDVDVVEIEQTSSLALVRLGVVGDCSKASEKLPF